MKSGLHYLSPTFFLSWETTENYLNMYIIDSDIHYLVKSLLFFLIIKIHTQNIRDHS